MTERWVAAWCAAQQVVEPANRLPERWQKGSTLRQIVRIRLGGTRWRLRLSNEFGDAPLRLGAASVAPAVAPGRADIDAARLQALRFAGVAGGVAGGAKGGVAGGIVGDLDGGVTGVADRIANGVVIPAGSSVLSDVLTLPLAAGSDLAVSLELLSMPAVQTGHPGSRTTSFALAGEHCAQPALAAAERIEHWYLLSDIETALDADAASPPVLVAIGDSITDGRGSTTDGNDRWPDRLAERWQAAGVPGVVLHTALGGNRLLRDGIGPSLASRFERDVLRRAGASHVLLHIGINDLGTWREHALAGEAPAATRQRLRMAMQQAYAALAGRARAEGLAVIGSTIAPYLGNGGYQPDADDEALRQQLNGWLRGPGEGAGVFDAVADFDAALRDPADPSRLRQDLHCGDHLHPSPAGMQALADAVPWPVHPRQVPG